ncbi:MAG TPA: 2-amino-4-hydroxy-6-hydroxymethyldihydropteridine diphosphokinase [Promineifilum sp.]|nr:2-amino-4-hydroxy-6-hydroxymethyldihydropteridine diphosphokinase [Promineifilum sp.]
MSMIYLSLGSNLDDRYANLQRATGELNKFLKITAISPVFATEPWGDVDQPPFLNVCVAATGNLSPHELLHQIKRVESDMGRVPTRKWGPRLIDIDILFYDQIVIEDEGLTIPHPRIAERAFVLAPLAVINPDFLHPQTGLSVREMLENTDATGVERMFEMPFPASEREYIGESV